MIARSVILALLAALYVAIPACKDTTAIGPDGSPSDVIFPGSNISYSREVQVLFNQTCALVGCHSGAEPGDQLKLDTYENLRFGVRGIPVVVPGSPENSTLVFRIEGRVGQRMPLNRNPLNQNQINGIRAWIAEGARNN